MLPLNLFCSSFAIFTANASPIPEEQPVMRTFLLAILFTEWFNSSEEQHKCNYSIMGLAFNTISTFPESTNLKMHTWTLHY